MGKWGDVKILHFLDIYQKYDSLWNSKLETYKSKAVRDLQLEAMAKEINIPGISVNDIRTKIKSIRTAYKRELSAVLKSKEVGKEYEPKLFWFKKADKFLRTVSHVRDYNISMKYEIDNPNTKEVYENVSENLIIENPQYQSYQQKEIKQKVSLETMDSENFEKSQSPQLEQNQTETVRNCNIVESRETNETYDIEPQTVTTTTYQSNEDDEYSIFCRSIATQLRSVPDPYARAVAKYKIQEIIFEAETGAYKRNSFMKRIEN